MPDTGGRLLAVNVGLGAPAVWAGRLRRTAIDKRPVHGRVPVGPRGLAGDEQVDRKHHGTEWQALYAYAREDAEFWAGELDREIRPGAFGENLTTSGVDASGALVGERWRVGSTRVQVTGARLPCRVFAGFWDVPRLVARFTAAGRPGSYLRVEEPGDVGPGDPVEVLDRPDHGVTVGAVLTARGDRRTALLNGSLRPACCRRAGTVGWASAAVSTPSADGCGRPVVRCGGRWILSEAGVRIVGIRPRSDDDR